MKNANLESRMEPREQRRKEDGESGRIKIASQDEGARRSE